MTEIIRRLEAGEEYEKLDGDYGSAFESSDFFDAYEEECPSAHPERRRPVSLRDPTLYDMADYLEEGLFQAEGAGGQR